MALFEEEGEEDSIDGTYREKAPRLTLAFPTLHVSICPLIIRLCCFVGRFVLVLFVLLF